MFRGYKTFDILTMLIITGSIAYDYIMDFPGLYSQHILPDNLHNINLSFIVKTFEKRRGGTAGNVSYSLALLDTPHILFSTAGKDFDEYQNSLKKMGISAKHIKVIKDTYTATGFGMTDKADNQIWGYFYGATEFVHTLRLKNVAGINDLVLIGPQGPKGSMSFVKQCIEMGIAYMFDPGFILTQVTDEDLTLGVTHASYIIGNDYELKLIKSRVKNYSTLIEDKIVITTLGKKGAIIEAKGQIIMTGSAKPARLVDPTGAGDVWRAGFLAGLEREFDLRICAQMGAVASSFCIEHYGTQEHAFTKKEFAKRYRETYNEDLKL